MKKLGILVLHGIGTTTRDFADRLIEKTNKRLEISGVRTTELAWYPYLWGQDLARRQASMFRNLMTAGQLNNFIGIRKFAVGALSDAVAYRPMPAADGQSTYQQIHLDLNAAFKQLEQQLSGEKPILIIAHSLGAVIASDYIWNCQTSNGYRPAGSNPNSAVEQCRTIAGIITFGCNIPLFALAFNPITAINFPLTTLSPGLQHVSEWNNYFDPDDPLGYPLKPLSESYANAVTNDRKLEIGAWQMGLTPYSHTLYWSDGTFSRAVADQIQSIYRAIG